MTGRVLCIDGVPWTVGQEAWGDYWWIEAPDGRRAVRHSHLLRAHFGL